MSGSDPIVTVCGKQLFDISLTANTTQAIALDPVSFGTRLADYEDQFQLFRFKKLHFKCHPPATTLAGYTVGYFKSQVGAPPTTSAQIYTALASVYLPQNETVPRSLILNEQQLLGGNRNWYDTSNTVDAEDYQQGVIFLRPDGTVTASRAVIELNYEIQFRGPTVTSVGEGDALIVREVPRTPLDAVCACTECIKSKSDVVNTPGTSLGAHCSKL